MISHLPLVVYLYEHILRSQIKNQLIVRARVTTKTKTTTRTSNRARLSSTQSCKLSAKLGNPAPLMNMKRSKKNLATSISTRCLRGDISRWRCSGRHSQIGMIPAFRSRRVTRACVAPKSRLRISVLGLLTSARRIEEKFHLLMLVLFVNTPLIQLIQWLIR